ncbi:phage tail protein [Nocardia sp. CC227C]|uniref:phage tail protein n=1 Tax=Nocardia sp. CC227C TaxID=3044562 RepID=UPI00278C88ED|nr:phage tail protein [Nocardia sp. CC227C]
MSLNDQIKIVWVGPSGRSWHLAGPGRGAEGVMLLSDPKALFFPPHQLLFDEGARQDGATFRRSVTDKKETDFNISIGNQAGLHIRDMRHWQQVHDLWWRDWSEDVPGHMCVWTRSKGWRKEPMHLGDAPEPQSGMDPSVNLNEIYTMSAVGADPFWSSLERYVSWLNSTGANEGVLRMRNDGSRKAWPRYTLKGPGRWFIEDPQADPEGDLRLVTLPPIDAGDTIRIDTHPRHRTARLYNAGGEYIRNVWAQMAGRRWLRAMEPWGTTEITVRIEGGDLTSEAIGTLTPLNARPM